jgi:hypothetical protein
LKYRAITCYENLEGYSCEVYYKVECATSEQMELRSFRLASPAFEFDSEEEAIKSLNASTKPLQLLSGKMIIPDEYNYPDLWEERLFVRWHPGIKELWPGDPEY